MSHLKRQKVPKNWPSKRKGTKYVVRPNSDTNKGLPILVILRDVLGIAQNRKEVKRAIHLKQILVNKKPVTDEKNTMLLHDIITIIPSKTNYILKLSNRGKFNVEEIKETESEKKVVKIMDKKILRGKRTQLNLSDGRNILSENKCNVNDSVLINLKDRKIEKCLPLKEGAKAIIFSGKHSGAQGIIKKINSEMKIVEMDIDKKNVNVLIKQLMAIE